MVLPMAMASQGALMGRTGQGCENPFPHLGALPPLFVRATNLKIMYSLLRAGIEIMYTWYSSLTIRFSMCCEITAIKSESQRASRERDIDDNCCKRKSHRESRDWESQRGEIGHFERTVLDVITGISSFDVDFQCHIIF